MRLRASNDELTDQSSIISESDPPELHLRQRSSNISFLKLIFLNYFVRNPILNERLNEHYLSYRSIFSLKITKNVQIFDRNRAI